MIEMRDYSRLDGFMESLKIDVYEEPDNQKNIIKDSLEYVKPFIKNGDTVLDVGCGYCLALEKFKEMGANPIGITLSENEAKKACFMNYDVRVMDMNFMDFEDNYFDFIWARHSLEHSIFPFFTLNELHRVLKPNKYAYFELPGIDTQLIHEANPNHYSVLSINMWGNLMDRVGFKDLAISSLNLTVDVADRKLDDEYYRFVGVKK